MNKQKENSGITLISLIITIIVMLILVAVTINVVINSGLIGKAKQAGEDYITATEQEAKLNNVTINGKEYSDLSEYVNGKGNDDDDLPKVTAGERADENSNYTEGGKTAVIPAGFTVSGVDTEKTIDGGLVIYLINDMSEEEIEAINWEDATTLDKLQTTYDQFVWIPVNDINDMYMCKSENDGKKSCKITVKEVGGEKVASCTTHNSIRMAGRLYAAETGENFNASLILESTWEQLREPASVMENIEGPDYDDNATNLKFLNEILGTSFAIRTSSNNTRTANTSFDTYLQEEYNEVVKSVYLNEGFYVGRYETSNFTTTSGTAVQVVKGTTNGINNIGWYYMYAQQVKYAENNNLSVGSTMIQGAAYDQVMKFVDTDDYDVTTVGNVGHDFDYEYNTGSQSTDQSKNIYDLEGNVRAWTTEASGIDRRVYRGGCFKFVQTSSYRGWNCPDAERAVNTGVLWFSFT